MEQLTIVSAINKGLRRAMAADSKVLLMGEDIGKLGGVFRVTEGLQKEFSDERVIDSPLAESGIVGTAIGLALNGFRPVVEIQFDGFVYPAFDQIVSQMARMRYRSRGALSLPITMRIPFGGGIGSVEHHSESPEAYFSATPGLRVISAADSHDAYWMIQQAIFSDDPVIFLEPKRRYWQKGDVDTDADLSSAMPMFSAKVLTDGSDCTLISYGPTVVTALQAAKFAQEDGVGIEVIDMRSLSPIDMHTIATSVRKTGRVIVVHEAPGSGGLGAEIGQRIMETCFTDLKAPVLRVTGYDTPYPASRIEEHYLPDADRILDALEKVMSY
ncbi:MAG: alpha-ketoacid dehydrogenase subunit beta [Streptomycetaceae bacterium]|nr:MAG: alpha-ketoacid dehydrogenase subunit beta [Streptomycetaceae bacterium]